MQPTQSCHLFYFYWPKVSFYTKSIIYGHFNGSSRILCVIDYVYRTTFQCYCSLCDISRLECNYTRLLFVWNHLICPQQYKKEKKKENKQKRKQTKNKQTAKYVNNIVYPHTYWTAYYACFCFIVWLRRWINNLWQMNQMKKFMLIIMYNDSALVFLLLLLCLMWVSVFVALSEAVLRTWFYVLHPNFPPF